MKLFPLAPMQGDFCFLELLWPGVFLRPGFTVKLACRLQGPLDVDRLRASIQAVFSRHDGIHTTPTRRDDEIVQSLPDSPPTVRIEPLPFLSGRNDEHVSEDLNHHLDAVEMDPFEYPLFRVFLGIDGRHDCYVGLVFHHMAIDGASLRALFKEICEDYQGTLGVSRQSFRTYCEDHATRIEDESYVRDKLKFWDQAFGSDPALLVPSDFPDSGEASELGEVAVDVTPALELGIERLRREAGTTVFPAHLATFGLAKAAMTPASGDLTSMTLTLGGMSEIPTLPIGLVCRAFPVVLPRSLLNQTAAGLLSAVHRQWLRSWQAADIPVRLIAEHVFASGFPDFTAAAPVNFQMVPHLGKFSLTPELVAEETGEPTRGGWGSWGLDALINPTPQGRRLIVSYDVTRFQQATIERLAAAYLSCTEQLPLLSPTSPVVTVVESLATHAQREALSGEGV